MAQPKATSESPRLASKPLKKAATSAGMPSGFSAVVVEHLGVAAVALGRERAVVVGSRIDTEALGEAAAPRPLLTARLVVGAGDDVVERLEGLEARGRGEARADEDVLVGKRQHGPPQLVLHDRPQHRVALRGPLDGRQADEHRRGAADALQRREREALELVVLPHLGDQHPGLRLLRQDPDLVREGSFGAQISELRELGVPQRSAVLGLDLDRHSLASPRITRGSDPSSPVDAALRRNSEAA